MRQIMPRILQCPEVTDGKNIFITIQPGLFVAEAPP